MTDCRRNNARHNLMDIITIAMLAVICGADGWVDVQEYGNAKFDWLKTFLKLPHGIPSHDTFGDVFAKLNPDAFERCFRNWMASMVEIAAGKLVAIDGKSLRRSFEHGWDKSGMAHMVSAFVQANRMVFGQVKTDGKGKELSAIEQLLSTLDLDGAVVTIDAIGTNSQIVQQILSAGADYILPVKDNQPTLHEKIKATMDEGILEKFNELRGDEFEETEGDHGRIETRKVWVCWDVNLLGDLLK
jgi:predicted transposase YbfD/YdcC